MKPRLALPSPFVLVAALLLSAVPASAGPIVVNSGQALEIRFTVPHPVSTFTDRGPYEHGLFYPDMIYFDLGGVNSGPGGEVTINGPIGFHSAYLYDGDTLLGVVTNNLLGNSFVEIGTFMSPSSLFYAGVDRQTVIDMTPILDGTIDGRLMFTISNGSLIVDDTTHITAQLGLGYSGTFAQGDDVNILSVDTVRTVPDAGSTLLLFGIGLVGLRAWRRRWQ